MAESPLVSIVMGSDSDLEIMNETAKALDDFGIAYEIDVTSAHRSPARTSEYARNAAGRGIKVIIAGAGGAAHLAGVIAAETTLPVIGVPIPSTPLNGMDSLLAIVQMPAGIPVATTAIGKPGRHERRNSGRADYRTEQHHRRRQAERDERQAGQERGREVTKAAADEKEIDGALCRPSPLSPLFRHALPPRGYRARCCARLPASR